MTSLISSTIFSGTTTSSVVSDTTGSILTWAFLRPIPKKPFFPSSMTSMATCSLLNPKSFKPIAIASSTVVPT